MLITKNDIGKRVKLRNGAYDTIIGYAPDLLYAVKTNSGTHTKYGKMYLDENYSSTLDIVEVFEFSLPFEKFQENDIVEFGGLEGVVIRMDDDVYPVLIKTENGTDRFTIDGRLYEKHTKPLLKLVSRPKKKVKRVVKTTVRYSPIFDKILSLGEKANEEILVTLEKEIEVEI